MKNLKQEIFNRVEILVKLDASVEKQTGKQSMSRRDLSVMTSLYTAKTCDLSTFEEKTKRAVNKELLDGVGKDSKKKIGQVAFNPDMLDVAKRAIDKFNSGDIAEHEVLPYFENLIEEQFQRSDEDGQRINDTSTFKGLNASLPKENQNKASSAEKTEQELSQTTGGDSKTLIKVVTELLKLDVGQLKKVMTFIVSLGDANQDGVIVQPEIIDAVTKNIPEMLKPITWIK